MTKPHFRIGSPACPSLERPVRASALARTMSGSRGSGENASSHGSFFRACQSPLLTGPEQAEAQAWASFARQLMGDLDGAAATAGEARSATVSARDHVATSIAMATLALNALVRGHLPEALQTADDAVRLADQSPGRQGHRS